MWVEKSVQFTECSRHAKFQAEIATQRMLVSEYLDLFQELFLLLVVCLAFQLGQICADHLGVSFGDLSNFATFHPQRLNNL